MNNEILHLSNLKVTGDLIQIKQGLSQFCDYLLDKINNPLTQETFSIFINDDMIFFKNEKSIFSHNGADVNINSTGLLTQLLTMIEVENAEELSDTLRDCLWDINAKISQGELIESNDKVNVISLVNNLKEAILKTKYS